MQLQKIYELCITLGKENDPRSQAEIEKYLGRVNKEYEEASDSDQKFFDGDRLFNPYGDTRILWGEPETEVKKVLAGIDIETSEILLADRLRERGEKIDLVLAHHPEGRALAALHRVMGLQEDILAKLGIPINVAEGLMSSRISEVERGLLPLNHNRTVEAARLLGLSLMCVHTPADNMVNTFLEKVFSEKEPETVVDVVDVLKDITEYQEAMKIGTGPCIIVGKKGNRAGKIFVDMTGGTSGSEKVYAKLAAAGVGTIVGMHMGDKHRKEAEENHLNVIIAGHMASDSLGLNLVLDALEGRGIDILSCSGLTRVKRI